MSQALFALSALSEEFAAFPTEHLAILQTCKLWLPHVDNWAHSDGLSKIFAELLSNAISLNNKQLIAEHWRIRKKWNKSKNLWERRQSIVSIFYYARSNRKYFPFQKVLTLVSPLIQDDAFYVQRGVGWTLREMHNVYPEQTFKYLKTIIGQLSPIAFSAATEKLTAANKGKLKKLRATTKKNLR
jgi:3-methyladenine DNA glycosylase AlkD